MRARLCPRGIALLEVLLVLAFVAMFFQLFPSLWLAFLSAADVRNWSSGVWLGLNIGVALVLIAIRFGPAFAEVRTRRQDHVTQNSEKTEHQRRLKEERELFERMREARKKQVV